eukprot:gene1550-935_t
MAEESTRPDAAGPSGAAGRHERARMHLGTLDEGHDKSKHFSHLKRSPLTPFFGSNVPEPVSSLAPKRGDHPCTAYSKQVHRCLDRTNNDFALCQSSVFAFNKCLNELDPV